MKTRGRKEKRKKKRKKKNIKKLYQLENI